MGPLLLPSRIRVTYFYEDNTTIKWRYPGKIRGYSFYVMGRRGGLAFLLFGICLAETLYRRDFR